MKKTVVDSSTSDSGERFLKLGGHPVLDFCNTLVFHGSRSEDHLPTPHDMELFFEETLGERFQIPMSQFIPLIRVRDLLRELLGTVINGENLENPILPLNDWLRRLDLRIEVLLRDHKNQIFAQITSQEEDSRAASSLVVSLFHFLTNLKTERLKKCANPDCSHFFYDTSKNNTRNWCSMKSCGNIMKARAFYQRSKAK